MEYAPVTGHYVYKYVYDGKIIYIGKTDQPDIRSRIYSHCRKGDNIPEKYWDLMRDCDIYYIELQNAVMSDCVESELIRRYNPPLNKAKTGSWSGLPFAEPEWKPLALFGIESNSCYGAAKEWEHRCGEAEEKLREAEVTIKLMQERINDLEEAKEYYMNLFDTVIRNGFGQLAQGGNNDTL